ncbi:MAG: carboxypeptidase regulatory-like domain-containing protein [Pyrinomonadaceae bacterium]
MKRIATLSFSLLFLTISVIGQTANGSIGGQVKDAAGAVIVGANVTVSDGDTFSRNAQTNSNGEFSFRDLPAGNYTVSAENEGFAVYENSAVQVEAGQVNSIEITLNIEALETEVTVSDDNTVSVSPEASAGAIVLKQEDIEALPDDEEDLEAALQALAGPAAGPNGGGIYVDGFSGGGLPPRDTIREIRINSNPFSSEYDNLGYGRIEILTKPGTDRFRGSVEFEFEDEALNSRNPFVANRPPFQKREFEAQVGGPIIKGRASYFINFERETTDSNAFINALALDSNLDPVQLQFSAPTPTDSIEFDPRFDFQINDKNTLIARYGYERRNRENSGLGGFNLLSRASQNRDSEHALRLTETAIISPKIINETRFQYIRERSSREGDDTSPTIRVLDSFTGGGANVGLAFSNEDRYEIQNYTSFLLDKHSLKVGARVRNVKLLDSSPGNFAGTFTFTTLDQYRDAILGNAVPTQFTIAGGDPEAGVSQTDYGLFVQEDWRVNPEVTLSFGLRYENQTNISNNSNFAPRFGFAYAPGSKSGSGKTVFRGGFGIFYDRFGEGLTLESRRFNGTNQLRFIVADPDILDDIDFSLNGVTNVPSVDQLTTFAQPQTTRIVSPDIKTPYTSQLAFSVERQLPFNTTFSATYLNANIRRLFRSRNINAPVNGVRPDPTQGNIFQYESTGKLSQNQLILNMRTRFSDFSIFGNYSLNQAKSDTDGAGSFPVDQFDLTGEYGRSSLDSRHRVVVGGSYDAPFGFRIRPFVIFRSGSPFNITSGVDTNGDTLFNDRPTFAQLFARCGELSITGDFCDPSGVSNFDEVIPRNYGTGPEFFIVNMRLSKAFGFGTREGGGDSSGGGRRGGRFGGPFGGGGRRGGGNDDESRFQIEFTVMVRNLFNRTNLSSPVGNLSSSFFGQSLGTAGGFGFGRGSSSGGNRRIELEIEFEF